MALRAVRWVLFAGAMLLALPVCVHAEGPAVKSAEPKAVPAGLEVGIDAELASDYIYRGVSLSARRPTAATSIEFAYSGFYGNTNVQSVKLPTNPAAEITFSGGYRRTIWDFAFDLSASYFYYPGEIPTDTATKTNYWEYGVTVTRERKDIGLTFEGQLAYSPDVSSTGAWSAYMDASIAIDLPQMGLPKDIGWQFSAGAGYWRFGNTSPAQGGFPLPAYTNWHAGLIFSFKDKLSFDLSYYDTSLSKEDCFVFTGDPMASAGGAVNPINNPDGLRSRLCGAAVVGTLTITFDLVGKD
jgi:uncharacterized protein (TIGR02001 family)